MLVTVSALLLITQARFGHSTDGKGLYRATMITIYGHPSPRHGGLCYVLAVDVVLGALVLGASAVLGITVPTNVSAKPAATG